MKSLLKANSFDVETAKDGPSALEIVKKGGIEIVITDLRMSPMDGMQLFEEIKAYNPEIPVILLTAYASVETAIEAMKSGIFDYLTKPFSPSELVARVKAHLARYETLTSADQAKNDEIKIRGIRSDRIEAVLGHKSYDDVIRSENLVLM